MQVTGLRVLGCEHVPMWQACEFGADMVWGHVHAPCCWVLLGLGISVHLQLCGDLCVPTCG